MRNAKDKCILKGDFFSDGTDMRVTGVGIGTRVGTPSVFSKVSFWLDTDGDRTVDTMAGEATPPAIGNQIWIASLANGGVTIPADSKTYFEIHADMASSTVDNPAIVQVGMSNLEVEDPATGTSLGWCV